MVRSRVPRREFLRAAARGATVAAGAGALLACPELQRLAGMNPLDPQAADPLEGLLRDAPEARFWIPVEGAACAECHAGGTPKGDAAKGHGGRPVKCQLCAHGCVIVSGERGRCRARYNAGGRLRSLVYGRPITEHVDPIEKKPFFHFLPGAMAFSFATSGCPLRCRFCQNWEISQAAPEDYAGERRTATDMVRRAQAAQAPVVAFTYNEPTVFAEYLIDTARAARGARLRSVLVSCGFMTGEPLKEMLEVLDAVKVDLKGFTPEFYRTVSKAELAPVLRSIAQVARSGRHLEIVNLVVPTLNDSEAGLKELCKWVAGEVGPDVPLHFTRFHPDYQLLDLPPTPVATLERAWETARKAGLRFAYVGNVPGHPGNHTACPKCGALCIERRGFFVTAVRMKEGACAACRTPIPGVWS